MRSRRTGIPNGGGKKQVNHEDPGSSIKYKPFHEYEELQHKPKTKPLAVDTRHPGRAGVDRVPRAAAKTELGA